MTQNGTEQIRMKRNNHPSHRSSLLIPFPEGVILSLFLILAFLWLHYSRLNYWLEICILNFNRYFSFSYHVGLTIRLALDNEMCISQGFCAIFKPGPKSFCVFSPCCPFLPSPWKEFTPTNVLVQGGWETWRADKSQIHSRSQAQTDV